MTNFQLKLLSGLLFSLAICLGVVLILPDNKVAETVTPELPKQVVKVEEKIEVPQKQIIDGFNFAEKPVEKNKLASADELDAFFNEIEANDSRALEVETLVAISDSKLAAKAEVVPPQKKSKTPFSADNLLSEDVFNLSIADLKKKFNHRFYSGNITHTPKVKSKVFPLATESKIDYDKEGLQSVRLFFKPKEHAENENAWKTIWLELQETLNDKYGCDFNWETRADGSILGKSSSNVGLRFFATYYCPDLIDRKYLSYITLAYGITDSRIHQESVKRILRDADLRTLANYFESKMYLAKRFIDLDSLKQQIGMYWRENQFKEESQNYFYTGIQEGDLYSLKISSRGFPEITNFLGRDVPAADSYHRWTTVDGVVKKIDIVSKGKLMPLFQIWHEKNLPALSVQFTGSKNTRFYYLHEYDRGSPKKIVKLKHSGSIFSIEGFTRIKYTQVFTFNKKNRLIDALIRFGNDNFRYSEDSKYKESSFAYGKPINYYGKYSDKSLSGVHLRVVFSGSRSSNEVTNIWSGIKTDAVDKFSIDPLTEVKNMLKSEENNWLLSYRTQASEDPTVRQIAQQPVVSTAPIVKEKIVLTPTATVSVSTLEEFLNSPTLFFVTARDFEANMRNFGAVWTDKLKRSARSVTPLKIGSTVSHETLFNFRHGSLSKVTLMVYNKGDQDFIRKADYVNLQERALGNVEKFISKKLAYKPNAGLARNHLYWSVSTKHLVKLESNFTQTKKSFSAEYIRLSFTPPVKGVNAVNIDRISSDILTNDELISMVSKDKDGSVYISGIPMVDQGQKGYCACAATARILNYYGKDIDQHEIAKLALSSSMGTGPDELKKALGQISTKLRLHFQTVVKCFLSNDNDIKRFLVKLERAYKKEGYFFNSRSLKADELSIVFAKMAAQENRYKDFKKGIMRSIDNGRPLAWALYLGIMPEADIPQASGGHMRLIIGYNEVTEQIYYSDTWGAGHEKKVMDMQSAFWVSAALWELRPR